MMHPAPVSGSPVPVRKGFLPSHPAPARAVATSSRCPDPPALAPASRSLQATHEPRQSQQPGGGSIPDHEAVVGGGRTGKNAAEGANQNVEDAKDRRTKDLTPPGDLTTTEVSVSAAGAAGSETRDATRGESVDVDVHGDLICPAGDASLSACTAAADAHSGEELDTLLEKAEEALARLYNTHDTFFSPDKDEKGRRLKDQAQEVLDALASVSVREGEGGVRGTRERARVSFIRGRALDVFGEFDPEAEKCLARAVKLRPAEADGWSGLGHCYWKKPDLFAARRCFLTSLEKSRSADTMRQLSMLLRQLPGSSEETQDGHLQESLHLAKEAVTTDIGCGDSWYVLGNAYVASFFRSSRGIRDLDRAMQAYKKAESNGGGGNPDLFFNRAHVFHYREDYAEAVRDYRLAQQLDPLLPVGPALQSIETGVERLARLVDRKGGLKAKRLSQLIAPLWGDSARRGLADLYRLVSLKELRLGKNKGVAVALKIVMPAGQTAQPPERFVVVDRAGEAAVLSLYSISKEACEKLQSKDTLVVKEPSFRTIGVGAPPPPRPAAPLDQPTSGTPLVGSSDAVGSSASDADSGVLPVTHDPSGVSPESWGSPSGGGKATASPAVVDADNAGGGRTGGGASGSATAGGKAPAASTTLPREHGRLGDPAPSSSSSAVAACSGPAAAAAAAAPGAGAGADAVLPTISYPGIQADPAEVLLNGETMRASFASPTVHLATFDK